MASFKKTLLFSASFSIISLVSAVPSFASCNQPDFDQSTQELSKNTSNKDPDLGAEYFTKKYSFSTPVLNVNKLLPDLFLATSLSTDEKFKILKDEAYKGNSQAQEKLYQFLNKKVGKIDFVNPKEAENLLNQGIKEERSWAFWQKGEKEKTSPSSVTLWHFLAANRSYETAQKYVQTHFKESWNESLKFIESLAKQPLKQRNDQQQLTTKVNEFTQKWNKLGYAQPIYELAKVLFSLNPKAYLDTLQQAADLGHPLAQIYYFGEQKKLGNKSLMVKYMLKMVQQEKPNAMDICHAAGVLMHGFGGQTPNKSQSLKLLLQAADQGMTDAMFAAGCLLKEGFEGQAADKERAIKLFLQAAQQGSTQALNLAGTILEEGFEGQSPDPNGAFDLYLKSANQGDPVAMVHVGLLLQEGKEHPVDKKGAFEFFLQAAKKGYFLGTYHAGLLLEKGHPANKKRALDFYLQAADQGYTPAMVAAGVLLEKGHPANKKRALDLYLQAADQGYTPAMVAAGILYRTGFKGQDINKKRALDLYLQAAAKGDSQGMIGAGCLYVYGFKGQPVNKKEALKLFKRAAEQGVPQAMHNAGALLQEGFKGQPADKKQATEFFLQAADQGLSLPMINLALIYLDEGDSKSALFWIEKAENLKDPDATLYLEIARNEAIKDTQLEELIKNSSGIIEACDTQDVESISVNTIADPIEMGKAEIVQDEPSLILSNPSKETVSPLKEDVLTEETPEDTFSSPTSFAQSQSKKISNVKWIRENLRQMAELQKQRNQQAPQASSDPLSVHQQETVDAIWKGNTLSVDHNALKNLFDSPFFEGQVNIAKTKSGIAISAFNRVTNEHASAGTHRKHKKTYKGAQPEFVKSLQDVLAIFDLKPPAK